MSVRKAAGVLAVAVAAACVLGSSGVSLSGDEVYTKYNIHLELSVSRKGERSYQASYSGWVDPGKDHAVLPPNSKVVYEPVREKLWRKFDRNKGFRLRIVDPASSGLHADVIDFEFNPRNMAMTEEEYVELITSPGPVSLSGLSGKDIEGIRSGKVTPGMTKRGVMTAFGYPAAHRTPHPEEDSVWTYWLNRFKTVDVSFDANGRVQRLRY